MEIGKFKLAKADLVRPPKKPIQEQIIPQEKPYTKEVFQTEVEPFIKGFIGGFPKNEMTVKLQSILDKAVEKGALSVDEGTTYMQDRKQQLLDFVAQNPGQTLPSLDREEFSEGSPKPQVTEEIKKKFPDGDFDNYKYGFPAKDPKYEKVRTLARTEQRAFYEKTPERVEKRRELHRKYYQEDPQKVLTRARISAAKPERVAKKKAYEKKQYYELGKREKDLARLRGEAFKKNVGSWQLTQDNVLLSDMVRAAQKGDTSLEIVRGGPNNSIVGVKEGNKIYHPVTGTGKPIADVPEKSIPITKHPLHKKRLSFKKQANAFANTKVPGTNITYGKALDVLQSEKAGTPLQKKNPAEFEHTKGVATDYSKGQIALRTANREKDVILNSLKQGFITKEEADKKLKKIGVKAFFKNRYIGAPTINAEKQFDDFKKYVDRQLNLNPELIKQTKIEKAKTIPGVTTADKIKRPERALIRDQIKDFQIRTGGTTLGAVGDIGMAKDILSKDFETAKKLFGKYAPQIARGARQVGKFAVIPELALGAAFAPFDLGEGRSGKETLLNVATLGMGVPISDARDRANYVDQFGLKEDLFSAQMKQSGAQYGAPALTEREQLALQKAEEFDTQILQPRLEKTLLERQAASDPNFGTGIMGMANGGRIGFADGYDPKRRKFMKAAAGIASIPVFGRMLKPVVKGMEAAGPAVEKVTTEAEKIFFNLVDAVKNKGIMDKLDKVTGGRLSGAYHEYKGAEVLEDAGSITARFKTDKGAPAEVVYIKPQKGIDPKTGKEVEYPGQFEYEAQEVYKMTGDGNDYYKDFEDEIIDSIEDVKKIIDD